MISVPKGYYLMPLQNENEDHPFYDLGDAIIISSTVREDHMVLALLNEPMRKADVEQQLFGYSVPMQATKFLIWWNESDVVFHEEQLREINGRKFAILDKESTDEGERSRNITAFTSYKGRMLTFNYYSSADQKELDVETAMRILESIELN
ncbi:hypothetical protein [Aestuariispira insulae]|uniref:Uncharacterized protein n=1 Tax=Aestuariispira insulae TaxID=1461337 RepID=A0A3D9HPI5_9PROT|nr:hypothetical protein [Aestuariispira insulae]RED51390.1 hypothetical protein DFP90_103190 [Aestuariispira insulae]